MNELDAFRGRARFHVLWIGGQQELAEAPRQLQLSLELVYRCRLGFAELGSHVSLRECVAQRRNRFGQIAVQSREPSAGPTVTGSRRQSADGTHVTARKEPKKRLFLLALGTKASGNRPLGAPNVKQAQKV